MHGNVMVDNWSTTSPVAAPPPPLLDSAMDDMMGVAALAPQFDQAIDTPRRSTRPIGSLSPDRLFISSSSTSTISSVPDNNHNFINNSIHIPTTATNSTTTNDNMNSLSLHMMQTSFASSLPKSYCPFPPTSATTLCRPTPIPVPLQNNNNSNAFTATTTTDLLLPHLAPSVVTQQQQQSVTAEDVSVIGTTPVAAPTCLQQRAATLPIRSNPPPFDFYDLASLDLGPAVVAPFSTSPPSSAISTSTSGSNTTLSSNISASTTANNNNNNATVVGNPASITNANANVNANANGNVVSYHTRPEARAVPPPFIFSQPRRQHQQHQPSSPTGSSAADVAASLMQQQQHDSNPALQQQHHQSMPLQIGQPQQQQQQQQQLLHNQGQLAHLRKALSSGAHPRQQQQVSHHKQEHQQQQHSPTQRIRNNLSGLSHGHGGAHHHHHHQQQHNHNHHHHHHHQGPPLSSCTPSSSTSSTNSNVNGITTSPTTTSSTTAAAQQPATSPSPPSGSGRSGRDLPHPTRCVLVRNLPPGVDDEDLRTLLSRHGELRDLGAQQRARGGRGSVLATFYDLRHARDAVRAIDGTVHFGRRLDARFQCPTTTTATDIILPPSASSPPTNSAAAGVGNNNNVSTTTTAANHGTLVVFNLDASTAADDVRALFSSIGDVKEIRATPNKKHHKFVEFYDIRDAERALHALNKTEVAGKRIKIEISRPGGRAAGAARAAAAAALAAQQQAMGNGESPSAKMASSSARTPGGQVHNAWSSSRRGGGGGGGGGPSSSPLAVPKARAALSMDDELDILASSFPPLRLSGTNAEAQSLDRGSTVLSGRGGGGGGGDGRPSSNVDHHHHLVHQQQQHCINNNNVRNNARLLSLGLSCANNSSNVLDLVDLAAAGELSSSAALSGSRLSPRESYREVLNHSPRSDGAASSGSPGTADGSASSPLSTTASAFGGGQAPRSFDEGAGGMLHGENNDLAIVRPAALHAGVLANGATSNGHALACVQQQAVGNGTGGNGGGQQQQGHHQSHVGSTSTNHAKFALDLERVRSGEETRTALMIRNIPNKYNQKMLVSTLEERHKGHFDFIYLPIDFKNKCNVGYAFINMTKPTFIDSFYQAFHGKKWGRFNSEKVCEITFARIQGRQQLIAHFQNSSLLLEDPKCRPVIFDAFGRQEEFPIGLHVRTRRGPCSRDSAAVAAAAAAATAAGACTTNTTSPSPGACVNGNAGTTAAAAGTAMMTNTCSTCTTSTSDNNSATATTTNTTAAMKTAGTRPANGCVTSQNMVVGSPCTTPTCTPTSSQLTGLTCGVSAAAVAAAGACVTTATTRTTTAPSSSADSLSGASGSCGGGDGSSRL